MPKKRIEHIYWFAYYNLDSPSVRYRAKYPLDFATKNLNITSNLIIPGYSPNRLWNFIKTYFSALFFPKKNSLIFIQRVRSNFIYSNLLKLLVIKRKKQTVYDLDDADYLEHDPKTIHYFASNCYWISAGSPAIAEYLSKYNKKVFHITSPTFDLGIVKKDRNSVFTIGWIGGYGWGHKDSLYQYLFPALKTLQFDCQLIIIGIEMPSDKQELVDYLKENKNIKLTIPENIIWKDETRIQEMIKEFDVGIATLLNHPMQIAKSGIKAKQYMNNGIPVIGNDLPENNNVIIDSYNGFICNSAQEFSEKLTELKNMNDSQYWEYSRNARNSITNFNHWKYFNDLEKMYNKFREESLID